MQFFDLSQLSRIYLNKLLCKMPIDSAGKISVVPGFLLFIITPKLTDVVEEKERGGSSDIKLLSRLLSVRSHRVL